MPAVNQEAERIIKGMKRRSASRFRRLYGKRAKEVMYATANKLAQKEQVKMPPTYNEIFVEKNKSGDSSLRDWFTKSRASDGTPGWVQLGGKYAGKPCAKQPGQTTKPKCGSSKMKRDLNKDEEERAFRRKNAEDPNPDRRGRAKNVATEEKDHEVSMAQSQLSSAEKNIKALRKKLGKKEKNIPAWMQAKITDTEHNMDAAASYAEEKDACYHKVKSRYKVWPSAYASGALVKCRKKGAANWGNKSEGITFQEFQEKALKCWKGCRRVPGTVAGTKGSCTCEDTVAEGAAWTKKEGQNSEGGLNEKGRKSYERENPGSDLKAPSKKVGNPRRKSFCARMKGMRKRQKPENNTGDDRLSKSLRAWNC